MKNHEQALLFLKKAAQDEALLDVVADSELVSDEIYGFHAQQAAEKMLKGLLSELKIRFRKTHDLRELLDLLTDSSHPVPEDLSEMDILTPYGTLFRYDVLDSSATFNRAESREMIRKLRKWVKKKIKDFTPDKPAKKPRQGPLQDIS